MRNSLLFAIFGIALACACYSSAKAPKKPSNIIDYVNWFIGEPEDEFAGALSDAWQCYLAKKPQEPGVTITVDKRNGFMRYEHYYDDSDYRISMEMCYWNYADRKHRLIAVSIASLHNGVFMNGQFDGLSFFIQNMASNEIEATDAEELGLDPFYGIDYMGTGGYDAQKKMFFIESRSGERKYLTEEENREWEMNRPINIVSLPRYGKDIVISTHCGKKITATSSWTWNGKGFTH